MKSKKDTYVNQKIQCPMYNRNQFPLLFTLIVAMAGIEPQKATQHIIINNVNNG